MMKMRMLSAPIAAVLFASLLMSQTAPVFYLQGWGGKLRHAAHGSQWFMPLEEQPCYWTNDVCLTDQLWDTADGYLGHVMNHGWLYDSNCVLVGHSMGGVRAFGLASRRFSRELYAAEFQAWRDDPANADKPDDAFIPANRFISAVITIDSPINGHFAIDDINLPAPKTWLWGSLVVGGSNAFLAPAIILPVAAVLGGGTTFLCGYSTVWLTQVSVSIVKDVFSAMSGSYPYSQIINGMFDNLDTIAPAMLELVSGFASPSHPGTWDLKSGSAFRKRYLPYRTKTTRLVKVLVGYEYECVDADPPARPRVVKVPVYDYKPDETYGPVVNPLPDGTIYAHITGRGKGMDAVIRDNGGLDMADAAKDYCAAIGVVSAWDTAVSIAMACAGQFWGSGILAAGAVSGFAGIAAVAGRQAFWDSIMTDSHDGFIPYRNQAYEDRSWVGTYLGKDSEKNEIWDGGVPVTYGQYFRPISADVKYSKGYAQFDVNHVTCLSDPAIWGGSSFKAARFDLVGPESALGNVKQFLANNGITTGTTTLVAP